MIVGIAILVVLFLCQFKMEGYNETFCGNCKSLTTEQCENCENCGVCETRFGKKQCVQGDSAGPYFTDKCSKWNYMGRSINKHNCRNTNCKDPYNCGYLYPYNDRAHFMQKYASMPSQL